jgi:hypothetical protein
MKARKYAQGGKTDPKKQEERPKVEKAVVKPKEQSMTYQPKRITKLSESGASVDLSVNGKKQSTMNSGELSAWLKNPENRHMYGKYREETHAANSANPKASKQLGPNPKSLRDPFKTVKTNAYSHLKPKTYANGGPITPDPRKKDKELEKKQVSAYEENRKKKQEEQVEKANSNRRKTEIDKRKRMEANPEQYNRALGVPAFYKPVGGGTVGVSTAEYRKPNK